MTIANLITRVGPSVVSQANVSYLVTHGLGNYSSTGPTPTPQGSVLIFHKRRGQSGNVARGSGPRGGMVG